MAFTTMHFAIGMAGGGAAALASAFILRRGMRWVPMAMVAGGLWACVPDMPRLFKEDFPNAPFAHALSAKPLQKWLNAQGDWFFFHRALDAQPKEYALHGLLGILLLFTVSCFLLALRRPKQNPHTSMPAEESSQQVSAEPMRKAA